MGLTSIRLDPRYHLVIPNTTPESESPSSSTPRSICLPSFKKPDLDRDVGRGRSWDHWELVSPISSPMSDYDRASAADSGLRILVDDLTAKREVGSSRAIPMSQPLSQLLDQQQNQPLPPHIQFRQQLQQHTQGQHQQLPSLSSIFGPSQGRPLGSPLFERPGAHALPSPLDRSYRMNSSSSSGPSLSLSVPRCSFDPRLQERPPYPPLTHPLPGPLSPRSRELSRPSSRSDLNTGNSGRWSGIPESGRSEHALGSRKTTSFRSPQDEHSLPRLPGLGREDSRGGRGGSEAALPEHQQPYSHAHPHPLSAHISTPTTYTFPATPTSTSSTAPPPAPSTTTPSSITADIGAEALPLKDGLGPKIWTGTHFLPRYVRTAEVPDEGPCFFYDDGSHCRTQIDGEQVNALWGVTKAGKPRKRLAIACITCREKKIKCDPDYPRCVQCEKFGRVCKFKNAPRGGHNASPSTPSTEPVIRPAPHSSASRPRSHQSSESVSPRTIVHHRPPSPLKQPATVQAKRMRIDGYVHYQYPQQQAPALLQSPIMPTPDSARSTTFSWSRATVGGGSLPELPRIYEDVRTRS